MTAAIAVERERLLGHAQREADEIRAGADAYARQVLAELEARLARLLAGVQKGIAELQD
jgi:F0F1-type ATP synthase membrane subunit b/b'